MLINGPIISLWYFTVMLHSAVGPPPLQLLSLSPIMSLWQSAVTFGVQLPHFCILQLLLNGPIISLWQSAVTFCSWSPSTTVTPSQPHYESMAIYSYPWYSAVAPFCILQLLLNGPILSLWQSAVTFSLYYSYSLSAPL